LISSVWHISRSWRSQRLLHVSYTSIKITQSTILPQKTFARGLIKVPTSNKKLAITHANIFHNFNSLPWV
ncbi:MAG: hypothetical protein WBA07_01775, partial [Rivularia sp. (in: cyanobacteria)]